jgi:tetratricopeptide (TPR) repeat protein
LDKVLTICNDEKFLAESPVLRAIKGHAYLAANSNNKSLEMFLSIDNEADRDAWKQWTFSFAKDNDSNAVALYLNGDALARLGEWRNAIATYSNAEKKAKNNFIKAMVLNARGVAYVYLKDIDKAIQDLEKATSLAPNFADVHASLGAVLLMKEAAEGALSSFENALVQSKNFALALNGKGCAEYGHMDPDNIKKAIDDFKSAMNYQVVKKLVDANIHGILRIVNKSPSDNTVSTSEGMTLRTRDMVHLDHSIVKEHFSKMSDGELKKAYTDFGRNAKHSERWAGIWDVLKGSGQIAGTGVSLDLTGKSGSSWVDAKDWRNKESLAFQEMNMRGLKQEEGGARTEDIKNEYTDKGKWPVKTWFGLAQNVDINDLP